MARIHRSESAEVGAFWIGAKGDSLHAVELYGTTILAQATASIQLTRNVPTTAGEDLPLSLSAVHVVQAAVNEESSVEELAGIVTSDAALTMRVLGLVNSGAFGASRDVQDIRQASSLIGLRGLRNVALSLIVDDLLPPTSEANVLLIQSLRRAHAARLLAQSLGFSDPDSYFSSGLLLDIGLLCLAGKDLQAALRICRLPPAVRVIHESAAGQSPHPLRGAELAARFRLPADTIEAIRHHHDAKPPDEVHARVLWCAERVAAVFESGPVEKARDEALHSVVALDLDAERAQSILAELPVCVEAGGKAFQRNLGEQPDLSRLKADASSRIVEMNLQYEETVRLLKQVLAEKEALTQQLQEKNAQLQEQATTDALTRLPNRRAMLQAMERDLARSARERTPIGFLLLDVDHFKLFNDRHGHLMGDEVLRRVGDVLLNAARRGDFPARYGGEEFCVLLPNANEEGAQRAATRLRMAIERIRVESTNGPLQVTASFGVTASRCDGSLESTEKLIARADAALYRAKAQGRNRVEVAPVGQE